MLVFQRTDRGSWAVNKDWLTQMLVLAWLPLQVPVPWDLTVSGHATRHSQLPVGSVFSGPQQSG